MTRWRIAWCVGLTAALFVLCFHSQSTDLLSDTDTAVLLRTIRAKNSPLSWFWSDWPLYNHFYRPIPALTFEIDSRLYGNWGTGFGWSNAIFAAAGVIVLFWFLREILDAPFQACAGVVLFVLWQTDFPLILLDIVKVAAYAVLIIGIWRHRKNWREYVPAFLTILLFQQLLVPLVSLGGRMLDWLPGRTASTMTVFALLAMAAYARYERLNASAQDAPPPSALDRPATKSARVSRAPRVPRSLWILVSVLATACAFACYEQAVMLPACLLGVAVYYRLLGRKVNWWIQGAFWTLLAAYLAVRHQVIPVGKSAYQAQQLRTSLAGPIQDLTFFLFPPLGSVTSFFAQADEGFMIFFDSNFYGAITLWVVFLTGAYQLRRCWKLALTGWLLPFIAFLPMAFVKMFEHYYYWPMALRTLLVVATGIVACSLGLSAVSPPTIQAPPRLDPAPGSLPRR